MGVRYHVPTGPLLGWAVLSVVVGGIIGLGYWAFGHKHASSAYNKVK